MLNHAGARLDARGESAGQARRRNGPESLPRSERVSYNICGPSSLNEVKSSLVTDGLGIGMVEDSKPGETLHVVEILEATAGGTRTHILHLLRGLKERGFCMTLVASAERNPSFTKDMESLRAEGIRVIEIPMVRQVAPLRDLAALASLRRVLRDLAPDIVHTHASKAGILGRIAARLSGVRAVIHTPHVYYFQGKRGLSRWFYRMLERMTLPLAAKTVLLCEGQRELARRELGVLPDCVDVIENGVDTAYFSPRYRQRRRQMGEESVPRFAASDPSGLFTPVTEYRGRRKREAREALGIAPDAIVVGSVTRFMPQKGCDVFLKAMARVLQQRSECCGLVVGTGPLEADLRQLAQRLGIGSQIHWRKEDNDPRKIYEALDVFALSSHYEGLPYALLEAMAMALPVVATRVTGCLDVIADGETGLLAPRGDPAALADRILQLLRDPQEAQRLGTNAREAVKRDLSIERFLDKTSRLYTDLPR